LRKRYFARVVREESMDNWMAMKVVYLTNKEFAIKIR